MNTTITSITVSKLKPGPNRKKLWCCRWRGLVQHGGKQKRYSRSFRTRAEAERFKAEKLIELRQHGHRDATEGATLGKLCDEFVKAKRPVICPASMELYGHTIRRLLDFFGADKDVGEIRRKDADLFMGAQLHHLDCDRELSPWSRSQIITHAKAIFGQAIRWDLIRENPFAGCQRPKLVISKWHYLRPDEFVRLLRAAPDMRRKALYATLYTSGCRLGEAFSLTWSDVDFERGVINIDNRKGSSTAPPFRVKTCERRSIPLPQRTLSLLAEWQAQSPEGVPFIFLTAERYQLVLKRWHKLGQKDRAWRPKYVVNNIARDFEVHCRRAQIVSDGKLTPHTLRKSFGQFHALNGMPIRTLMYLMGHSNEKTTLRYYAQVDPDSAARATARFDRMLDAATSKIDAQTGDQPQDRGRGTDAGAVLDLKSGVTSDRE